MNTHIFVELANSTKEALNINDFDYPLQFTFNVYGYNASTKEYAFLYDRKINVQQDGLKIGLNVHLNRMVEICSTDNSIRDKLIEFNNILSKLNIDDLSPEDIQMFRELVTFCTSNKIYSSTFEQMLQTDFVLKTTCNNLCHLFARYLFYREIYTARICAADQRQCLEEYHKDHQTYEKLIQCEMDMLKEFGVHFANNSTVNNETNVLVTKIAFIGSGPIPNSSMTILNDYAPCTDIYNIDMCEEANQLASMISKQILPSHLSKRMHFITQDITEEPLPVQVKSILNQCQLIYLATVVGMDELEKLNILKNIVNQSNDDLEQKSIQYFVIRTTEGFWKIFFPKVTAEKIAMLQATNDSDVRHDINGKFLFQIKAVQHVADKYGITRIIATNIN